MAIRTESLAQLLGVLRSVPHLQLVPYGHVLRGVEVDVDAQLVGHAVLLMLMSGHLVGEGAGSLIRVNHD